MCLDRVLIDTGMEIRRRLSASRVPVGELELVGVSVGEGFQGADPNQQLDNDDIIAEASQEAV